MTLAFAVDLSLPALRKSSDRGSEATATARNIKNILIISYISLEHVDFFSYNGLDISGYNVEMSIFS